MKGDEFEYWCTYDTKSGRTTTFGSPAKIPPGAPLPPLPPGQQWRRVPGNYQCPDDTCQGPLAPLLETIIDLLPVAWRPGVPPDKLAEFNRRNAETVARREERLRPLPAPRRRPPGAPLVIAGDYCCVCGETGGCFTSGGDCRLMPVKQRRLGQC